jgi:hypothetical protein
MKYRKMSFIAALCATLGTGCATQRSSEEHGHYQTLLSQIHSEPCPWTPSELGDGEAFVQLLPNGKLIVEANNIDNNTLLMMISIEAKVNFIQGRSVPGNVSIRLYNVWTFRAIDAIRQALDHRAYEENGFIYSVTDDQLADGVRGEERPWTPRELGDGEVYVERLASGKMIIEARNVDNNDLLHMIAIEGRANIISSRALPGNVSIRLYNVWPITAADAIWQATNQRAYEERGFIFAIMDQALD